MKHEFALYVPQLPRIEHDRVIITDADVVHRVAKVLRLKIGERIILFDDTDLVHLTLTDISKKQFSGNVTVQTVITPLTPEITCFVPLLKRHALEEVAYAAAELGANRLQLVLTEKVQRKWGGDKELQRLQVVLIAACEQAKQFAIPTLYAPISLEQAVAKFSETTIFFDPEGQPAYEVVTALRTQQPTQLSIFVGPEGDLSGHEKDLLREQGVVFCALTPTVLRARQAFVAGLCLLRSLLR